MHASSRPPAPSPSEPRPRPQAAGTPGTQGLNGPDAVQLKPELQHHSSWCAGAWGAPKERRSATARLISSGMIRLQCDDLGPVACDSGNGNQGVLIKKPGVYGNKTTEAREAHGGRTTETAAARKSVMFFFKYWKLVNCAVSVRSVTLWLIFVDA